MLVKMSSFFTRVLVTHKYCVFLELLLKSRLFQSVMNGIVKHERYSVVASVLLILIFFFIMHFSSNFLFLYFLRNRLHSIKKKVVIAFFRLKGKDA